LRTVARFAGNYIDTLLSVPWTTTEATPLELSKDFVALARKKLDDDHFGLGASPSSLLFLDLPFASRS